LVDAVDLRFGEVGADGLVDLDGRGQVVAEGLFQHDARLGVDQACGGQLVADGREQRRRRRQVEHPLRARARGLGQRLERGRLFDVQADVFEQLQEAVPRLLVEVGGRDEAARLGFDDAQVGLAGEVLATRGQDARRCGQVAVQVGHVQGGQQLAHREVAHAAEDDHVEGKAGVLSGGLLSRGAHV